MLMRGWGALRQRIAQVLDRFLDRARAQSNLNITYHGACDREHERSRITEVAVELNWTRTFRQLITQFIKPQIDIVQLFPCVFHVLIELDEHECEVRETQGANTVV